jgi:hypothetical protein
MSVPFVSSDGTGGKRYFETTVHQTDGPDTVENPRTAITDDVRSQALMTGLETRQKEPSQIDTSILPVPSGSAEGTRVGPTLEGHRDGNSQSTIGDEEFQSDNDIEAKLRRELAREIQKKSHHPSKLKIQRETGRKRGLQASQFIIAIENRVRELEFEVKRLQGTKDKKLEETNLEVDVEFNFPPKEMSAGLLLKSAKLAWSEFSLPSHRRALKEQSTIDLLIEKPHSFGHKPNNFTLFEGGPSIVSDSLNDRGGRQSELGQSSGPVERIRLNSSHLEQALEDIIGGDISLHDPESVQQLRPFKAIIPYTNELIAKLLELEQLLEKKDEMAAVSTDGSRPLQTISSEGTDTEVEPDGPESRSDKSNSKQLQLDLPRPDLIAMRDHIKALVGCFETRLSAEISSYTQWRSRLVVDSSVKVSFTDLWYLFAPGDLIYDHSSGQALRILSVRGGSTYLVDEVSLPPHSFGPLTDPATGQFVEIVQRLKATDLLSDFVLTCFYLNFNGIHFGPVQKDFVIEPFEGSASVDSLAVMPIEYAKNSTLRSPQARRGQATDTEQNVQEALLSRGRLFADLARPGEAGM